MSLFAYVNGTVVPVSRIRMRANGDPALATSTAADGTMAQGAITFEDPTYDYVAQGWYPVIVKEPDCTSAPYLFKGYIADQTYGRGEHYLLTNQRQIDTTVNDSNVLMSMQVITGSDGNRPAETDTARMAWLLGSSYVNGLFSDLGLISTLGLLYDATDFRQQYPYDVLNDLASARGYFFYVYVRQSDGRLGLFYDRPTVTSNTSTLTFSNVLSDITLANGEPSGTVFPGFDIEMVSDPSEVYCQVVYVFAGGRNIQHSQTTHDTYFSWLPSGVHRSVTIENTRVGKATTAASFAIRLLEHYSVERRQVTFGTRLPSTSVGLIQAGQRVGLKFIHVPELSSQQYYRVEELTVAPQDGDPSHYEVQVRASVHGLSSGIPIGPGGGGDFPHQPSGGHFYTESFPVVGDETYVPNSPYGLLSGKQTCALSTAVLVPGTTYNYSVTANWYHGAYARAFDIYEDNLTGLPFTHPLALTSTQFPDAIDGVITVTGSFTLDAGAPAGANWRARAGTAQTPHGHDVMGIIDFWVDPVGWDSTDPGPMRGQWIYGEIPTPAPGSGRVTFSTAYAFATGSLRVWVDDVDQTQAIVSTDGQAKTFTLGFDPRSYEIVKVDYQGIN